MRITIQILVVALAAVAFAANEAGDQKYDGYKVYKLRTVVADNLELIASWETNKDVDFWEPINWVGDWMRVMVAPNSQRQFEASMDLYNIEWREAIDDLLEALMFEKDDMDKQFARIRSGDGSIDFGHYWTSEEIVSYMRDLSFRFANTTKMQLLGRSSEDREIYGMRVTNGKADEARPMIFVDAGLIAREWASPMAAVYLINQLVENAEKTKEMTDKVDWFIMPIANPDGFEYTHTTDRLWKKTRSVLEGSKCFGVDATRNFDYKWTTTGVTSDPCSNQYAGSFPLSEPETQIIRDVLFTLTKRIKLYISMNSYGSLMLYPYAYANTELPENWEALQAVGESAAAAVRGENGTIYRVGTSANLLSFRPGSSIDFASGITATPYAYTWQMVGGGNRGFDLAAKRLKPVLEETMAGFGDMAKHIGKFF